MPFDYFDGGQMMPITHYEDYFNNDIATTMDICFRRNNVYLPKIKKVIFNGPATIILWYDKSKTVVKCMDGETFDKEKGLAMAICKKLYGNDFHKMFKEWCSK